MNKDKIVEILFKNMEFTDKQMNIIRSLEESREEWEAASRFFQYVSDPSLIDYAIYTEDAARAKFMYYLNQAKKENIEIDYTYMLG